MYVLSGHEFPIRASSQCDVNLAANGGISRDMPDSPSQTSPLVDSASSVNESQAPSHSESNSQVPNLQSENSVRF